MWQDKRSSEKEILDLGPSYYTQVEYDTCMHLLGRINRLLGGFSATKSAIHRMQKQPRSILDIGCGGGALCQKLHQWLPLAAIKGIDISSHAIEHAQNRLDTNQKQAITFELQQDKKLTYPDNSFDLVTTMLVCHHMSDEEIVLFLQEAHRIAKEAVIINDLQRHLCAFLSFSCVAPFLFRSRLIWHDGRLSIRRGFRKKDWTLLLHKAGFTKDQYVLRWHWAFRWTLTLRKS